MIPSDKKGLEIAINLLNDDIFQSSWDDNIGYVTDNKTTLKKSGKSV